MTTATISPDPVQFGNVDASTSNTLIVTLSFSEELTGEVTLSISAPFSVSPQTVPTGDTSVSLTLTYDAPASAGEDAETLTLSGAVSDSFDVTGMVGQDALTTTAEKYLLLQVPDYGDTTFANPCADAEGFSDRVLTSFLRLGKFEWDDEPAAARWLLKLIPQVTSATDPSHVAADEGAEADLGNELGTGVVFADDLRDRPQDWVPPAGDTTSPLTSADDPAHKLTKAQRAAESALLYSRGGWRDHSDGNRISTTFGDKVEVIRGNYKMIVMGRQDDTGEAMGWDVGGSHIQDFAAGTMPGASFWLEWVNDGRFHRPNYDTADDTTDLAQKGVWLLVNTTENVYEYARNAGNFREEKWGDVDEVYVGSSNPPSNTAYATDDSEGTGGHEPPHRLEGRNYDYPGGTNGSRATPPWSKDNKGTIRSNPHIIEKTWAERIDSHTGSSDCPVPHIEEKKWADKVVEVTELGVGKTVAEIRQDSMTTVHGSVIDNTRVLGMNLGLTSIAGLSLDVTTVGGVCLESWQGLGAKIETTVVGIVHLEAYGCLGWHISLDGALQKIDAAAGTEYELKGLKKVKVTPADDKIAAMETSISSMKKTITTNMQELALDVLMMAPSLKMISNNAFAMSAGHFFL